MPVLKEAGWPHRDLVVHTRLFDRADAPVVAFAEDTEAGYVFLTRQAAPAADPWALLPEAVRNLSERPFDLAMISKGIAASAGRDLAAERLLDPHFIAALSEQLGEDLWIAVPHRVALYALRAGAPASDVATFVGLVSYEAQHGPEAGHAPVSTLAFRVTRGQLRDAVPLDALASGGASPSGVGPDAMRALGVPHPSDLVLVDPGPREINASVLIVGSGARRLGRAIHVATGGASAGPPWQGDIEHFVVRLGAVRGWTTRLFIYAVDGDPATAGTAEELASASTAVVLAEEGATTRLDPGLVPVARGARRGRAFLALLASDAAAVELERQAGVRPDLVAQYDESQAMALLRAVTRQVLAELRAP